MKKIFSLIAALLLLNSCVKDDDYATPPYEAYICSEDWTSNRTVSDVIAEIGNSSLYTFPVDGGDKVLEGFVISSDETGNFYKTISIQDSRTNPTKGIQIELNKTNLFNNFPVGSKIRIKLNGLKGGVVRGVHKIGGTFNNSVGQLDEYLVLETVKRACDPSFELNPIVYNNITDALQNGKINTLITIKNVQFVEAGEPYSSTTATTNRTLIDTEGKRLTVRNSSFANFASNLLPENSGAITIVLSGYDTDNNNTIDLLNENGSNEFQAYIRDTTDVKFDQPRFDIGDNNNNEAANLMFNGADFENWTTFLGSLNSYGLTSGLAIQGIGNGREGSNSFHLNGTTGGSNPFVFTVLASASTIPTNPSKITMWVKGSSSKSLSFNLDTATGRKYYNLGELDLTNKTLIPVENNQYVGTINTGNEWRLVTLDISDLNLNTSGDLLALKIGSSTAYNVIIDNIKID